MKEVAYRLKKNGETASFLYERFVPFDFETDVVCDSSKLRAELKKAYDVWELRGRPTCVDAAPYVEIGAFLGIFMMNAPKPSGVEFF